MQAQQLDCAWGHAVVRSKEHMLSMRMSSILDDYCSGCNKRKTIDGIKAIIFDSSLVKR